MYSIRKNNMEKQCRLKNKTQKANKQQDIGNIEQKTLKSALLKQYNIEKFINRNYTHISTILENSIN